MASPAPYAAVAICRLASVRVSLRSGVDTRTCASAVAGAAERASSVPSSPVSPQYCCFPFPAMEGGSTEPVPFWPPATAQIGGLASRLLPRGVSVDGSQRLRFCSNFASFKCPVTHSPWDRRVAAAVPHVVALGHV